MENEREILNKIDELDQLVKSCNNEIGNPHNVVICYQNKSNTPFILGNSGDEQLMNMVNYMYSIFVKED